MVRITLPSFWAEDPALWFAKVDAIFALNEVTSKEKYSYVITELDKPYLVMAKAAILQSSDEYEEKYLSLQDELIKQISISQLEKETFDEEQKPSEFYKYLKNKADKRVNDESIKIIWINGLPKHVKDTLMVDPSEDIEYLKKMADKVMEVAGNPKDPNELKKNLRNLLLSKNRGAVYKVITVLLYVMLQINFKVDLEQLKKEVGKMVSDMFVQYTRMMCGDNGTGDTRNDGQSTSALQEAPDDEEAECEEEKKQIKPQFCWYHDNWGHHAHQCCPPCNFKEFQVTNSD